MSVLSNIWNKLVEREHRPRSGLLLGWRVEDGSPSRRPFWIPSARRAEHISILGKTGTGKTSLLKCMLEQDIKSGNGFLCIDLHGDLTPFVLSRIADREQREHTDFSPQTLIVDPADPNRSVGMNILEAGERALTVLISEIVAIFCQRWGLEHFGARTEELLRNTLWVLAESGHALTELAPLLTDFAFRAAAVQRTRNNEVKAYFRNRFDQLSDAMQTVVREAILNKATAFTVDPAMRQMLGQRHSTFDFLNALDRGLWVVLSLPKGRLGNNAETLAALLLTKFKNAIFARRSRTLFSIYADELQNLVTSGQTFETLLAEARKFSVSVVTANQHLQQYPAQIRSALFSAGTMIAFRCSAEDAPRIAAGLNAGKDAEQRLKELPNRQFLARTGEHGYVELASPVAQPNSLFSSLLLRSQGHWTRSREDIEAEIGRASAENAQSRKEELASWK